MPTIEMIAKEVTRNTTQLHKRSLKITPEERLKRINKYFFKTVVPMLEEFYPEAKKYYVKREKASRKLGKIKTKSVGEIDKLSVKGDLRQASSYSAKMDLIGDTDLDMIYAVKNLTEEKLLTIATELGKIGFKYIERRGAEGPNKRWMFNKYINNVEIDLGVRDYNLALPVLNLHKKIDNKLEKRDKELITFGKYKLKNLSKTNPKFRTAYADFKYLFYQAMFSSVKNSYMMRELNN